jgi:hypothetical protein
MPEAFPSIGKLFLCPHLITKLENDIGEPSLEVKVRISSRRYPCDFDKSP